MLYIFASSTMYCVFCRKNLWASAWGEHCLWGNHPKSKLYHFWRHWRITKAVDLSHDPRQKGSTKDRAEHAVLLFPINHWLIFQQQVGVEKVNSTSYGPGDPDIGVEGHQGEGVRVNSPAGTHACWYQFDTAKQAHTSNVYICIGLCVCTGVYTQAHTFISELKQEQSSPKTEL